jgi:hypothetical protein
VLEAIKISIAIVLASETKLTIHESGDDVDQCPRCMEPGISRHVPIFDRMGKELLAARG